MEPFWEEAVGKRGGGLQSFLYGLATALMALCGLLAALLLIRAPALAGREGLGWAFFLALLESAALGGCAALLYSQRDKLKTEFEYTFTAGQLDIAQVFNNKTRKALGALELRRVDACGPVSSPSFRRYAALAGVRKSRWYANRKAALLYFFIQKDGKQRLILIEPSEKMTALIQKSLSPGAWQIN